MGTVKIVQSCRDEIFESWLKSIGQDIRPHLSSSNTSFKGNKKGGRLKPFYKFFEFKKQLIVYNSGKVLIIDRSSQLYIENEIKGTINISDNTDIILRTEFKSAFILQNANSVKETVKREPIKESNQEKPPKRRDKVSLGKPTIKTSSPGTKPSIVVPPVKEEAVRKMRGVEIDESF